MNHSYIIIANVVISDLLTMDLGERVLQPISGAVSNALYIVVLHHTG